MSNSKVFNLAMQQVLPMQYGGGISGAYSTLSNRRKNLPLIKREAGGGADYDGAAEAYADMAEENTPTSGFMDDTDAGLYADAYGQPGEFMSPEDRADTQNNAGRKFSPLDSPIQKMLTENPFYFNPKAPKNEAEQRQQDKNTQNFANFKSSIPAEPLSRNDQLLNKLIEIKETKERLAKNGLGIRDDGLIVALEDIDKPDELVEDPFQFADFDKDGKPTPEFLDRLADLKESRNLAPTIFKQEGGSIPITSVNGLGIPRIVYREDGGSLNNIYQSRINSIQNMYGMGDAPMQQTPSQMSSVFQDPMEASAFSPVNMEHGGDIVVPKERMINDQPHELSYINPQEAGLLKALGGSGRRVDGIPAYFWSSDEGDGTGSDAYQDLGSLADEMDQADMDAGAASLNLDGDYRDGGYVSLDSLGNEIVIDSDLDRAINEVNLRNAATLGGQAYRDRFDSLGKIDPRSQFNNLDVFQRGIDRDLYQKAGIPLANLLEQKGLATFGKGMRGPLEAYTPGDALYRNLEDVPEDSKRGEYDPEALVGNADLSNNPNKAAIQAFNNGLRYSKSGDTIADVTQSMKDSGRFSDAEISSAAATMGYSPNSSTQASQVYDSLNDSRMSGALQGLTLMAGGLASPTSIITAMGQSYGDRGETRDPYSDVGDVIGKLTDKATDTLGVNVGKIGDAVAIVNNPIGYLGSKIDPSRRGVLNRGTIEDLKAQQARQADIAYNSPSRRMVAPVQDTINYLDSGDVSLGSLAPDPREAPEQNMFEEGISSIVDFFGGPEAAYRNNIDTSFGSGNDQPDRRRVVQAAVPTPSPVKEDEELTGIKGLLARRKPAASRRDSNKFSELLLSSLYPNQNINLG